MQITDMGGIARDIKIGDYVCFKADIEQSGKVVGLGGGNHLVVENRDPHTDEPREHVLMGRDIWIEG